MANYACQVVFIRRKNEGTPLPLLILGMIVLSLIALGSAILLSIEVDGNLLSPITEGPKSGLPIAVMIVPLGALGIAPLALFAWMAIALGRSDKPRPAGRRRDRRTR